MIPAKEFAEFGERLSQERREKAARDRRDLGSNEIAEAIGTSGASMSRWEAGGGVPNERKIRALAEYFGVTPAWLRYGIPPRFATPDQSAIEEPESAGETLAQPPRVSAEHRRVAGQRGSRRRDK